MRKRYYVLDLFCGAGGISAGLEQVDGFKTVVANDFNHDALETFKFNHPNATCVYGDITDSSVRKKIIKLSKENNVNMIVGGPPCQGFSSKGKKLGLADERNYLFLEYIKMVEAIEPEVFLIENVRNLVTCANGYFIQEILNRFSEIGYYVDYRILNAYNFGVPQNRERTIIIGTKNFVFDFDDLMKVEHSKRTVFDAISDLAYLNSGEGTEKSAYITQSRTEYQDKLRNLNDNTLYNHKATNHSSFAIEKLSMIPPEGDKSFLPEILHGKQKFKTTWSRLQWDEPSPTIDTRFDTPSNGKNSHPFLNRAITPREAARIQSFSDSYVFLGKKTEICKQIGNAVPPLLASAIGKSLIRQVNCFDNVIESNSYTIFNANANYILNYFLENGIMVDHIITDPPYVISKKNNFNTMQNAKRKGIDFGVWDSGFSVTNWIPKYGKLVKKNGSIIVFCSYRYISYVVDELENNGFVVKDFIEWKKSNPMPRNIGRRYVQDTEFAIWAVKENSKWVFNKETDTPYLRSCFTTSTVSGSERTIHPTQKSLELMRRIIKIHSNPGDLILDMFMGSGTTGVAAVLEDRRFIGVELAEEYFFLAQKRLSMLEQNY